MVMGEMHVWNLERLSAYDLMLKVQADMAISHEAQIFAAECWHDCRSVLDFGCGNGYYLSLLTRHLPSVPLFGYDIDKHFISVAQKRYGDIATLSADFENITSALIPPIGVIFRLTLHHIPEFADHLKETLARLPDTKLVYVVNPSDTKFDVNPQLPLFFGNLARLRAPEQNRVAVHPVVSDVLTKLGYPHRLTREFIISAEDPKERNAMFLYMCATAAMGCNGQLSSGTYFELLNWLFAPDGRAQYGLIASVFARP
jgi:SAM-dependent methyltransferase